MVCLKGQKASNRLLSYLLCAALTSSVLILSAASFGVSHLYHNHVIEDAELDAVGVGRSILALEKHLLIQQDNTGKQRIAVPLSAVNTLDEIMNKALAPLNVLKVKVFSTDGVIQYSTDHSIIGYDDSDNPMLRLALSGQISSELERKGSFTDLIGEKHLDVHVIETYLPITDSESRVIGSFEIYQDVDLNLQKADASSYQALAAIAITLCIAFGLSFLIIRVAVKELRRSQEQLHQLASEDTLTGLFNRNRIIELLATETERLVGLQQKKQEDSYCLIMLDVDHFKSINDTYGHPCGDKVLKAIAQTIKANIRDGDQVGRYGGEEFLLILPETEFEGARALAERVRQAIDDLALDIDQQKISVTASLGIATKYPVESDYEGALKRADVALYQAKEQGRNRVEQICTVQAQSI